MYNVYEIVYTGSEYRLAGLGETSCF